MTDGDVIRLRCSPANRVVFEHGVYCDGVRIVRGEDGIYEIELLGVGPDALPDSGSHPLVPVDD